MADYYETQRKKFQHHSQQPVKVFAQAICNAFLNIRQELNNNGQLGDYNLEFVISNEKVIGPKSDNSKLYLHDVYLSYLWTHLNGLVITVPIGGKELVSEEISKGYEALQHAQDLLSFYRKWNDSLPTLLESSLSEDRMRVVGVTNATFWYAINYIMYHEFAHKVLGHIDQIEALNKKGKSPVRELLLKFEKEADLFAFTKLMKHRQLKQGNIQTAQWGILTALSSIVFTSNDFSGGDKHPDPDERIKYCIESFKIADDEHLWGFGMWIFIIWGLYNNEFTRIWPIEALKGTHKDKFYVVLQHVNMIKEERKT